MVFSAFAGGQTDSFQRFLLHPPQPPQQGKRLGVVGTELSRVEREEVVAAEVRLGGFGEELHGVHQGVRLVQRPAPFGVLPLDLVVAAAGFGAFVGGADLGVLEPVGEEAVVVGVGQFVQREVGHPAGFGLEDADVGELDRLGHGGVAPVVAQPSRAGVVFGLGSGAGVFGREPERHLPQLGDGFGGHFRMDLFELPFQQAERLLGGRLVLVEQGAADLHGPTDDRARFVVSGLRTTDHGKKGRGEECQVHAPENSAEGAKVLAKSEDL